MKNIKEKVIKYLKENFKNDLIAGVVVGLVALPLAIAFAIASGARPEQGIYSAIIAGAIMAVLSGSNYQVSGPTGAFIVILLSIVNQYGIEGLLLSGFMAGIILVIMGAVKFGSVIKYIPYPVTVGFTSGIAVIIFTGQIKNFLGLKFAENPHGFIETISSIAKASVHGINSYAVIVGLSTLAIFFLWTKFNKKFPAAPVALLGGILVSLLFMGKIPVIGEIPSGFPSFHMLTFSWSNIKMLLPSALTIAALGAIESLLSAVVADGMTGAKHNSNRELISQGVGNMVVPFFGGIPATGAIARTATNIKNGARTRMSAFIHAIVLLLIILIFAPWAKYIPLAALAAILLVVAYTMSEMNHFIRLLKAPSRDIAVLLTTFLLTIFVDLSMAVGVGIVLAALLFIKRISEANICSLEENAKLGSEGSRKLHASVHGCPQISLYEISGPMFFGAASVMRERIGFKEKGILIIRMKHVHVIDATAIHALELLISQVKKAKGKIILATIQPRVLRNLRRTGVVDLLGGEYYLAESSTEAVDKAKKIIAENDKQQTSK